MTRSAGLILAFALVATTTGHARAATPHPVDTTWLVWTSRMEGASVNVEEAAQRLAITAQQMHQAGRVNALGLLVSDALELRRRMSSAALAAQVKPQG